MLAVDLGLYFSLKFPGYPQRLHVDYHSGDNLQQNLGREMEEV